ncbi:MAG: phospho-N-acetylmuramoyl-pentapeptide-transferase [bacterium]|nr:phospho-N-acetylmuramoyl-pentapeptide-transferase [bacterium]
MLYYIYQLRDIFSPLNVFQYITFRALLAFLFSLIFVIAFGEVFIKYMKKKNLVAKISPHVPQTHRNKEGTALMGGALILFSVLISSFLFAKPISTVILALIACIYLGIIGIFDDYNKTLGEPLSKEAKLFLILVFAVAASSYMYLFPFSEYQTKVMVPYLKEFYVSLGSFFIVFSIFVITGSANAVNLSDGLDGLAAGLIVIVAFTYAVFSYVAGHYIVANYLKVPFVSGAGELAVVLFAVAGSCTGFLWHNFYPAKIFMGDSGSLFLGGLIGVVSLIVKQELVLLISCGVFVIEVLSVFIQVYFFKKYKKRFFKMAPIHHHFELSGLQETKVTIRFWIFGVILAILALASLKIR